MKKILSFLLAAVMLTTCVVPAKAAEPGIGMKAVTVQEEQMVYVTVSLQSEVTGTAMALTYTYDNTVLEIDLDNCSWLPDGVLNDFDRENPQAAWASKEEATLSGDVCVLALRVLDWDLLAQAKVDCSLTVDKNDDRVGEYQASSTIAQACTHQFSDWVSSDELEHSRKCSLCGYKERKSHEWYEGSKFADPQNPDLIVTTYLCKVCGDEKTEEMLRELTKITVSVKPAKLIYIQNADSLDVTGGELTLTYNDGTTETMDLTADMVTGFDNSQIGRQELTITYGGCTTQLYVTVQEDPNATSGTWGGNLTWELSENGTLTISGTGDMLSYKDGQTDPSNPTVDGYPWHRHNDKIKAVVVEAGVTSLAEIAFHGLENLTDVTLPESLTTIGDAAFAFCTALEDMEFPEHVSSLGKEIFYGSTAMTQITFVGNAPVFDPAAFGEVTLTAYYPLKNLTWTSDVMQNYGGEITWKTPGIGGRYRDTFFWEFDENNGILTISGEGVLYSDNFQLLPWDAYCSQIEAVVIEDGLTILGENMFVDCPNLTKVTLPGTVTTISYDAFSNCTSLQQVTIPDSVVSIHERAFENCTGLTTVVIPDSVHTIKEEAFRNCRNLTEVALPESVTEIAYATFADCSSLAKINIPQDVTTISYHAFDNCSGLQEVRLSESITSIGNSAFADCTGLVEVTFPASLESIDDRAFSNCGSLGSLWFTGSAPIMEQNAFADVFAEAGYPGTDASWTEDVLQNYGGGIRWIPYGDAHTHVFGSWVTNADKQQRSCDCGYTEERILSDGGSVEIGSAEEPDLTFQVDPVKPADEEYILVEEAVSGGSSAEPEILKVFDINLKNSDGVHVQPEGTVKVKLPLDWTQKGNYKVYRVNDDGTLTDMQAYRQGSHMVFETDHFSLYVIVEEVPPSIKVSDVPAGEEIVYVPVSLQSEVMGMSMSLSYTYDSEVLKILPEECSWIPKGVISDFDTVNPYAAWTAEKEQELSGELCVLAFRILDLEAFENTEIDCTVTVKNEEKTVGVFQDSGRIVKVCPDIDGSGSVNDMDAIYLMWHTLFPETYPLDKDMADFNCDGKITDADAVSLLWYALFRK